MSMKSLGGCILAGCVGFILAALLVPGFTVEGEFSQSIKILLLAGVVLGLINFFIKPIINLITLPLRWLTFGLFGLLVNLMIVWTVDIIFSPELSIVGFKALFLTALLVWLIGLFAPKSNRNGFLRQRKN